MALPAGYRGLVVCDAARAKRWRAGLASAGFTPVVVATSGDDADKGDFQIGVPRAQEAAAAALVSAVLEGKRRLPVSPFAVVKLVVTCALVVALVASLVLAT
jgi:hypothetical protein